MKLPSIMYAIVCLLFLLSKTRQAIWSKENHAIKNEFTKICNEPGRSRTLLKTWNRLKLLTWFFQWFICFLFLEMLLVRFVTELLGLDMSYLKFQLWNHSMVVVNHKSNRLNCFRRENFFSDATVQKAAFWRCFILSINDTCYIFCCIWIKSNIIQKSEVKLRWFK